MNPLNPNLHIGTLGELIVQLRLLQFDVQSVSPHKDTGNDLLATRGEVFKALQVKATSRFETPISFSFEGTMARRFHILALVFLFGEERRLDVDRCAVYLLAQNQVQKGCYGQDELADYRLTADRIAALFV